MQTFDTIDPLFKFYVDEKTGTMKLIRISDNKTFFWVESLPSENITSTLLGYVNQSIIIPIIQNSRTEQAKERLKLISKMSKARKPVKIPEDFYIDFISKTYEITNDVNHWLFRNDVIVRDIPAYNQDTFYPVYMERHKYYDKFKETLVKHFNWKLNGESNNKIIVYSKPYESLYGIIKKYNLSKA